MINTLSKIGWEGGWSTSILIMSLNILGFVSEFCRGHLICCNCKEKKLWVYEIASRIF